uniref:Uncharacterized protein n=1 Tax=Anguilla anguilla TaxID=7936 RepID=A0A0E9XMF7_ANGAN
MGKYSQGSLTAASSRIRTNKLSFW